MEIYLVFCGSEFKRAFANSESAKDFINGMNGKECNDRWHFISAELSAKRALDFLGF